MFNFERNWILMEHHRHEQIRQAWSYRLCQEAERDQVTFTSRLLVEIGRLFMTIGSGLLAHFQKLAEKPHDYISTPQDPVYN